MSSPGGGKLWDLSLSHICNKMEERERARERGGGGEGEGGESETKMIQNEFQWEERKFEWTCETVESWQQQWIERSTYQSKRWKIARGLKYEKNKVDHEEAIGNHYIARARDKGWYTGNSMATNIAIMCNRWHVAIGSKYSSHGIGKHLWSGSISGMWS